ncbi:MAG: KR domain-containing protein, partial [bacterium]|nr:KR domain-containing protein [bacterium]
LIQNQTDEILEKVLSAKVQGSLVLDRVLADSGIEPDFIILCSSLNAFFNPIGLVGYSAANAFLDAFAFYRRARKNSQGTVGSVTVSVNWDGWQKVGMAVNPVKEPEKRIVRHPLLDHCFVENGGIHIYVSRFNVPDFWVFNEHRLQGKAALPGTAYLEMVHAAAEDLNRHRPDSDDGHDTGNSIVQISELFFFTPMFLEEDRESIVHTRISPV